MGHEKTYEELLAELHETYMQLEEANDTIEAIRSGGVDALVVKQDDGLQIFTLKSSDHSYRIFIEQMTQGAVTLNHDGHILYCNSQFALMVKYPLEKVTGQIFVRFITVADQPKVEALISEAWNGDIKGELNLVDSDGSAIPVLLSLKTLDLDEGISLSVIVTDLSQQKAGQKLLQQKNEQLEHAQTIARQLHANLEQTVKDRTAELETNIQGKIKVEEKLRSNQERLTSILETMAEGVVIVDADGKPTYSNPMAQKILRVDEQGFLQRQYGDHRWQSFFIDGRPLPHAEHPLYKMMANNHDAVYDQEIAIRPNGADLVYISINAATLRDDEGKITGGVCTFMDVTNRRKIAQQKDEFISVASHELKTPLTSLKASMQLLTRLFGSDPESKKLPGLIEMANKNLSKIVQLTEDLMNVAKLQHGQLVLNKTVFDLAEMVNECCENLTIGGSHKLVIQGDKTLRICADRLRIDQVMINLVNNAIKYAPDSAEIIVHIEQLTAAVKVSVQDFGIGIPPEKLRHLFDRYYRADPSGIQFSGLGLGLYISHEIIERHGGQMGVVSTVGQGSTFWFTLPA